MEATQSGQVNQSAAEVYEEFFVPALFGDWAPVVADAAALSAGQRVLDVACGTGVLAREAQRRVRPDGAVTGLDRNPGMLEVAGRLAPEIEFRSGMAEAIPFAHESFDAVVSQFGLMFFEDRIAALAEMWRVLRPDGFLAVAVWASLDDTPGYRAMTDLLQRLFGDAVADALRAPFVLGDPETLAALVAKAGIPVGQIETKPGAARFPSIGDWVHTDVKGWTLADLIDDHQYETLQREAAALASFVQADGTVAFSAPAHILTATKS